MMQSMKAEVFGMKKFVGIVEGKSYDSTKVFIKTILDQSSGNAVGYTTQELNAGTSKLYDQYCNVPLPAEFEIDIQLVSTGKAMKQVVSGMRPVQASRPASVKA